MTWQLLARVLAPAVLIGTLATSTPAASQEAPSQPKPPSEPREWPSLPAPPDAESSSAGAHKTEQTPNLAWSLQDDAGRPAQTTDQRAERGDTAGTVRVTVEAVDAATGSRAIDAVGGTNAVTGGNLVEADVAPSRLAELAGADGVQLVREPRRPSTFVESEGVGTTTAGAWQTAGFTGAGANVAVIDAGFNGYTALLGNELPAAVAADLGRCGSPLDIDHGTGVAEIVHDMAPDAALRLVCIDTDVEIINALDTLPATVDVVNISLGWTLIDRGDGSGPIAAAVDRARERGVLVVVAAGNYGNGPQLGTHRHQNASGDTPGPSLGDLVNMPGGDDALAFLVAAGETASVSLQWDAWPNTAQDFDLYIVDDGFNIVAISEGIQNGIGGNDPPIESAYVTNTTGQNRGYWVIVNRYAGSAAPRMDVFFDGGVFAIEAPTGSSVSDPAVAHGAMAVGAHCYSDGAVEYFSSVGPTIDGRVKPDISGPDATSTSTVYGNADGCTSSGFFGTSAAAPHVVGAAAQLLDANPDLDVAELQRLLERKAVDAAPAGPDNTYGAGRLHLGAIGDAHLPAPQAFTGMDPTRLLDSRPGSPAHPGETGNRITPVPAGGTLPVRVRGGSTGVPSDAVAVVLNVTVVGPTSAGYVTVFPDGPVPTASNVNFAAGQTVPVHVTATVADDDRVRLFNAAGNTHMLVDIAGWYGPTGVGGPSVDGMTPLPSPARVMDTRGGQLGYAEAIDRTAPIGPGQTLTFDVVNGTTVPADVTGVILNLTGITPTSDTYLTVHPGGGTRPTTSNLNPRKGQTVANLVVVPVGPGGSVSVFNAAGSTHTAIDVLGYFRAGVGAGYVALDPPTRQLDTRTGTGLRRTTLGPNSTFNLRVARYQGVPGDAAAVMLSVVAVGPSAGGYLTVYPGGTTRPNASNLNFPAGATTANAVLARFGTTGQIAFHNPAGNTHLISDLAGYFIDAANVQLSPP